MNTGYVLYCRVCVFCRLAAVPVAPADGVQRCASPVCERAVPRGRAAQSADVPLVLQQHGRHRQPADPPVHVSTEPPVHVSSTSSRQYTTSSRQMARPRQYLHTSSRQYHRQRYPVLTHQFTSETPFHVSTTSSRQCHQFTSVPPPALSHGS